MGRSASPSLRRSARPRGLGSPEPEYRPERRTRIGALRAVLLILAAASILAGCGSDDQTATTSAATTAAADDAAVPADVFGEYERDVTQADVDRTSDKRVEGPGQEPPTSGTYRLVANEGVIQVFLPDGFQISQELTVTEDTWEIERYIGGEGVFCVDDGPSSYSWDLEGDELSLVPKSDGCADRDSVLTGTWTKSG